MKEDKKPIYASGLDLIGSPSLGDIGSDLFSGEPKITNETLDKDNQAKRDNISPNPSQKAMKHVKISMVDDELHLSSSPTLKTFQESALTTGIPNPFKV